MTPGGSAPAFSRGQPASYYGIMFLSISECWLKAIAYTDLLPLVPFIIQFSISIKCKFNRFVINFVNGVDNT